MDRTSSVNSGALGVVAEGAPQESTPPQAFEKVVIAIHGIGDQQQRDTIRTVAHRFSEHQKPPMLPMLPLGYFHVEEGSMSVLEGARPPYDKIGFKEVFWADIPRHLVAQKDMLEESKAWGKSVASRAHAMYMAAKQSARGAGASSEAPHPMMDLEDADFDLGNRVLEEVVESLDVLEHLTGVLGKMGVFEFDVAPLLRDYLGDVQVVSEFKTYRDQILARFHKTMNRVCAPLCGGACEVYIVAHSEGTVIAFLALLQALSALRVVDPEEPAQEISTDWVRYVRGFMTLGSPIDKHLVLWPRMWEGLELKCDLDAAGKVVFEARESVPRRELPSRIRWRNYYDRGDPVGFQLDTARRFLKRHQCVAFEFEGREDEEAKPNAGLFQRKKGDDKPNHDIGFSRYPLPGKAHVDYWEDDVVFKHFINDVVMRSGEVKVPRSKWWAPLVSYSVPYLLTLVLHACAVFALYKGVTAFLDVHPRHVASKICVLGLLMTGITVAARLPRLVKSTSKHWRWAWARWYAWSGLAFMLAAAPTWLLLPRLLPSSEEAGTGLHIGASTLVLLAAVVALSGWLLPRSWRGGRRSLMGAGVLLAGLLVVVRLSGVPISMSNAPLAEGVTLQTQVPHTEAHDPKQAAKEPDDEPVWPLLLSAAAFLYLWKLGILLFDLSFVWHRYIRHAVVVQTLGNWHKHSQAHRR